MIRAGLSTSERKLMDRVAANEQTTVTADDVSDVAKVDRKTANVILSRLAKKGWLQRLKRGVYVVIPLGSLTDSPAIEKPWLIAARLFEPCLISGWSAAEHWGMTDQIFNVISLVTSQPQRARDQQIGGTRFRIRTLPAKRIFGSKKVWFGSASVNVADPHRTLIDILDAPDFGGGGRHVLDIAQSYWTGDFADPEKILEYANQFGRGTVFKRLGLTAEEYGHPSDSWFQQCMDGCSRGISLFDPCAPDTGSIRSRWGIKVNVPLGGS